MNSKIYVVDSNGNQIVAEGVAYIVLSGEGYKNEYLFYTLNEVVNGDLTKIYVAKVNNENPTIDDDEWENVKRAMLAIVHKEEILGLSFDNFYDEQGNSKTFKVDFPRKIALKMDKLMGLKDEYKLAVSNPDSTQDAPAFGSNDFFDKEGMTAGNQTENKIEVTSAFDGSLNPVQTDTSLPSAPLPSASISVGKPGEETSEAPTVNVAPVAEVQTVPVGPEPETPAPVTIETVPAPVNVTVEPVAPVAEIAPVTPTVEVAPVTPEVAPTPVEEASPVSVTPDPVVEVAPVAEVAPVTPTVEVAPANVTVSVTPAVEPAQTDITPPMPSIVPEPIPGALGDMPAINNSTDTSVDIVDENDFAIPVSIANQNQSENMDSVIFDQIIEELKQIKNQNTEIRESIKRLTSNIDTINTTISALENKTISSGNAPEILNTNTSNTSEEVSAVEMSANGSIVVPKYDEVQQSAAQAVNVLTTSINPTPVVESIEPQVTPTLIEQPTMIEQPTTIEPAPAVIDSAPQMIEQPTIVAPVIPEAPTMVEEVATIPTVEPIETSIITPATDVAPAIIEQPVEAQVLPDVPMMNAQPAPTIVVPQFDPNAGLPPVVMPTGVSSGDDGNGGIPGLM